MTSDKPTPVDRRDVTFQRAGNTLSAWHFPPASDQLHGPAGAPAIVLAHGFGLTRDCGLETYGEHFAAAGLNVVVFDYTGFGPSGGGPREVVSVRSQLADYAAAIEFARGLPGVDPDRVAVWGTSYSGGLAIAAAATDGRVAAVVSQVPNLDNMATLRFLIRNTPVRRTAWLVSCIARDVWRKARGRDPYYVQAVGPDDAPAAYVSDESWTFVAPIAGPTWVNRVGLRDFATVPMFRALTYLEDLPCRVQLFGCTRDDLTPVQPTLDAAARLGDRAELHTYPAGHFEIYAEPYISQALTAQVDFLVRELAPRAG